MRHAFISKRFGPVRQGLIAEANRIIEDYQGQGYRLTLRQLFYQMVSRNLLPNTERAYKNLGETISDGRLAGVIDWEAIEDRIRVPRRPPEFEDLADLAETALRSYRLPRWKGQAYYVELWVEKDALAGVLEPLALEAHVTMMVNRGYSSQSAMFEAGLRFRRAGQAGRKCVLLYLGDHDPSGEDMVRDVQDRLNLFGADVAVIKLALTMAQVQQYNPPPNPAKRSDSRAAGYIERHGASSWEVDALPPEILQRIIRHAFRGLIDAEKVQAVVAREEADKAALREAVAHL